MVRPPAAERGAFKRAATRLMSALAQVDAMTPDDVTQKIAAILDDARRQIYLLLAAAED